ncbi:hypothetical protein P7B02_09585 [Caulobacter segnis]|uniref:hypothetical protein n=1 Tax=Caulobacter segnis TaxID=88688 RepID=UPI0024107103|nr:hypothetical protein [Caulobacter segnis]MDG2521795.1 hypothetical protein [Caulobacter segnis]
MSLLLALLAAASTVAAQPSEGAPAQDKPAAEKPAEKKKMVCAKVETPGARVAKKVCRPATEEELAEAAGK